MEFPAVDQSFKRLLLLCALLAVSAVVDFVSIHISWLVEILLTITLTKPAILDCCSRSL